MSLRTPAHILIIGSVIAVALAVAYCRPTPHPSPPDQLQELHEQAKGGYIGGVTIPATPAPVEAQAQAEAPKPAPVVKKAKRVPKIDQAAWLKGALNAARAECLRVIVDFKIDKDVELGVIRNFPDTAMNAPICHDREVLSIIAIELFQKGKLAKPALE